MGVKWGYVVASLPGLVLLLLYAVAPAAANVWAPRVMGVILLALAGLGAVAGVVGLAVWASPKTNHRPR